MYSQSEADRIADDDNNNNNKYVFKMLHAIHHNLLYISFSPYGGGLSNCSTRSIPLHHFVCRCHTQMHEIPFFPSFSSIRFERRNTCPKEFTYSLDECITFNQVNIIWAQKYTAF